jgi:hypothetical protein
MRSTLDRAVNPDNIPDAAAALAELRALGGLIEGGMKARPLPASGRRGAMPDLEADAGDGIVTVEVHAKHEDGRQTELRQAVADGLNVPGVERTRADYPGGSVTSSMVVLHPGGAPDPAKPFDSIQANVISKLCGVKKGEAQRRAGVPSVLWLDLSYFGVMTRSLLEQTIPVISGHIGLTSGAIWYAFYGWKGAPILEEGNRKAITMGHEGRFRLAGDAKSRYAAAIICFDRGLIVFENPWAETPLPPQFRRRCERLPWFKMGHSVVDWTPGEALHSISYSQRRIEALAAARHL